MKHKYDGLPNFVTWRVSEAANDPANARYWRGMARWHASEANARHAGRATCREARHDARLALAQELSKPLYDEQPSVDRVYRDLLNAAIEAVNFDAIADRFLAEFFDDPRPRADEPDEDERSVVGLGPETRTIMEWLRSDWRAASRWREAALNCLDEARRKPSPEGAREAVTEMLAEALRDEVPGMVGWNTPNLRDALTDSALARVHWGQLARRLIRDYGLFDVNGPAAERKG
jgi:hypothetical protein